MQFIADFFVDALVVPAYFYFLAYGIVWVIAFVLARLLIKQNGVERATTQAWRIAIVAHMFFGTVLIVWICFRAIPRVPEWWHIPFYLILYVLIVIVDLCLLVSLPTQRPSKSRNPKKK